MELKCVICDKPAKYLFLGYGYCKKHKDAHLARMKKIDEEKT